MFKSRGIRKNQKKFDENVKNMRRKMKDHFNLRKMGNKIQNKQVKIVGSPEDHCKKFKKI